MPLLALLLPVAAVVGGAQSALAADGGDWFDPVVNLNMQIIGGIDSVVGSAGVAVIGYTLLVKLVTAPLNQFSMRTNVIVQALQPQTSEIQRRYEANEISADSSARLLNVLYNEFGVTPLTGLLLPVLVQLPVLVALFRAIAKLAGQDKHFQEAFLWIPSLSGPVDVGRPSLDWLLKTKYSDHFEPLIGWQDAGLYLVMPLLLIVLQLLTQRIVPSPGNQGWVTYLFTAFIGISALVTPQAVGVYWLVNTGCTALQMSFVKGQVEEDFPKLMQVARRAAEESDGVRYTRRSEFREETASSKAVDRLAQEVAPEAPAPRTRPAKRRAASAKRRRPGGGKGRRG